MIRIERFDEISLLGVRVIDPLTRLDAVSDVVVRRGVIETVTPVHTAEEYRRSAQEGLNSEVSGSGCEAETRSSCLKINARGLILCPGLADIHVHLREPGFEHKETIGTGCRAAAGGGFTFVAPMPNTKPAVDSIESVRYALDRAAQEDACEVGPIAAITVGREGRVLADFASLLTAGAVAFSDDGVGVEDDAVMADAFRRARDVGAVLIQHCEYRALSAGGVLHKGAVAARRGWLGLDPRSEDAMIERDLRLCRGIRARYHVAHLSTATGVELVRRAKEDGLPVTAEVTPHHLLLTDEACDAGDTNAKMHPPLRTAADVEACRRGLLDGTIDCVATDHAPHTAEEKARGMLLAPPGLIGLETAVPLVARAMIETGLADWAALIRWFTEGPMRVLGRRLQAVAPRQPANLTLLDPAATWKVEPTALHSRSFNTPFLGWTLTGRAVLTIVGRRVARRIETPAERVRGK